MKIIISLQTNSKLLEHFPNDPYANISIKTSDFTYNLSLAYLTIDSTFFSQYEGSSSISLQHLPANETGRVLRALYGDQLIATTYQQLQNIYQVIEQLNLQEYKKNIAEQINNKEELQDSLEIMNFCFEHEIHVEKIYNYHLQQNLNTILNPRAYLHLNKISQQCITALLVDYYQIHGDKGQEIINQILENYLCRNQLSAVDFFKRHKITQLKAIWESHHHKFEIKELIKKRDSFSMSEDEKFMAFNSQKSHKSTTHSQSLFEKVNELRKMFGITKSLEEYEDHSWSNLDYCKLQKSQYSAGTNEKNLGASTSLNNGQKYSSSVKLYKKNNQSIVQVVQP